MTIKEVIELVKQIDALTDEDFLLLKSIVFVRGMARELKVKRPPGYEGFLEFKDCNPNPEP